MLARPLTSAETRARFEQLLAGCRAGTVTHVPTGVGLDIEVEDALWAVVGDPSSDVLAQRARDELEAQLSGARVRAQQAAIEVALRASEGRSKRRSS